MLPSETGQTSWEPVGFESGEAGGMKQSSRTESRIDLSSRVL
jgi:hypothetical protein